ncbi:MAG: galactonate dehydratase [Candidatus Lokiarchaeota archaeon]|nr:galactonate dehydratase [Candidatus Lokiarchaeota archaeon]
MKITDIKTFVVNCYRTNWVFVKIETDEGVSGLGEATLEQKEQTVIAAIEELRRYLMGKDPRNIELHYHQMYRDSYWRIGPVLMSAISGIEMALWDISAKYLGTPVYMMLGGKYNTQVKAYANAWFSGADSPKEFGKAAKEAVGRGFKALKWDPFGKAYMNISHHELDSALENIAEVRAAVGPTVDLAIEGHGRFNVSSACLISKKIEEFEPMFFEEPVPPDDIDSLLQVKKKSNISIASGERLLTRYQFKDLFEKRAVDIAQPDVSHAGGILECRKIASMAEARYINFAPHNPSGPVANAATLQIAACTPNFFMLEMMANDIPWRKKITDERLIFKDGYFEIQDSPGLGISLNEDALTDYPYSPTELRHYRGDLTDIRPANAEPYF